MDGKYPDDLNKNSGVGKPATAPGFARNRPPEDADLYLPPSQRSQPKWRKRLGKVLKVFVLIVIVAAVASGIYFKFFHDKPVHNSNKNTATQTDQALSAFTTKTKNYTSTNVGLTFTYPETWIVADNTSKLTATSPTTQLTDVNGQTFQGQIVLTVQPKGTTPKAFAGGGIIAALNSEKISYTKPTSVQRAQTYLTFLQYTQALVQSQLDGIYVTGDFGYQQNQYVPTTDIAQLDPLISVTFMKCSNSKCTTPVATSVQSDMWNNNANFQKTISATLESIQVSE